MPPVFLPYCSVLARAHCADFPADVFSFLLEKSSAHIRDIFLSYKIVFITKFVTLITKFVTHVRNFVTKTFCADSKNAFI